MNLPRSGVLVLGSNALQSLLPATLAAQVEALLQTHHIPDAVDLAEKRRIKLQSQRRVDEDERDELCYVYQCIGFECLRETLFEDAGKNLFLGQLDPRALISYFPELRGSLFTQDDHVDIFSGVTAYMPPEASVDDIIMNYSPHMAPNTRDAPVTAELRRVLRYAAEQMLEVFLRMHRFQSRTGVKGKAKSTPTSVAVDTVLAKIYAKNHKAKELHTLIGEPNDILFSELEPVLLQSGQYAALCRLYEREGNIDKLLDTWAKLADGQWVEQDENAPKIDPTANIEHLVTERRDRALSAHWGIWMSKKDPERGFRLIISRDGGRRGNKGSSEDDKAVLESLQQASPLAASRFLEYLVLQRRTNDPDLHTQLAVGCVDSLLAHLQDEQTNKLWRAKLSSYTSSPPSTPFLSYFASTTPDSKAKRARLRAILFLQGSVLYDPEAISALLQGGDDAEGTSAILALELAILAGKMGRHEHALALLALDLRDAAGAEAYCALGGAVVPARAATALGEQHGLQLWAALLARPSRGDAARRQPTGTADEDVRRALVKILLGVYMRGGEAYAERTAQLLNSQAMNVDVLEVIPLIPDDWPLGSMSSILARSFRRTLHAKHEGQIVKNISMSENLKVAEETWEVIRVQDAIIEEDDSDDEKVFDEKGPDIGAPLVHELHTP